MMRQSEKSADGQFVNEYCTLIRGKGILPLEICDDKLWVGRTAKGGCGYYKGKELN